ncbi:MAG: hypothetical protein KKG59_01360 [Nanoarchaeota archaeon]|nr:hypothetical protein [Nanoarchaeota archaeon]
MAEDKKTKEEESEKKDIKKEQPVDTFAKDIENINIRIKELKERTSELRKKGKDPFFADISIRNAVSKIHYAEVTREQKDRDKITALLDEAKKELDAEEQRTDKSIMDEVNQMVEFENMTKGDEKTKKKEESKTVEPEKAMTKDIKEDNNDKEEEK